MSDNKRRWFIGAVRTALLDQLEGGRADEVKPENFDIIALLKGILVEVEHTNNPLTAMEIAMDHLAEFPEYYNNLAIMEKAMGEGKEIEEEDSDEDEIEDAEEGAPAPTAISSVLTHIADHIDKSSNPSKRHVVSSLKRVMKSIRQHPHFKTAAKKCEMCDAKSGEHRSWCPDYS